MSRAEELADALDNWDGLLMMPIGWRQQTSDALRRLAQVEAEHAALLKAISDAEPKGWLCVRTEFGKVVSRCIAMNPQDPPKDHRDSVEPLYTLNGIKK